MINIKDLPNNEPCQLFLSNYEKAIENNQKNIEAICISSFNINSNEVESRFVNLKYIIENEWIFFSNYNSPKSECFNNHKQVAAVFYWNSINTQIRIKANIKKSSASVSDKHFQGRSVKKNAIAISSKQSKNISSYEEVISNFQNTLKNAGSFKCRPEYWGGYSLMPYYFEFWYGNESRINERISFKFINNNWEKQFLQP